MQKVKFFVLAIGLLMGGCSQAPAAPTHTPTLSLTPLPTLTPSITPTPTFTFTPTPLPPELSLRAVFRSYSVLSIIDGDFNDIRTIVLPLESEYMFLEHSLSPDGNWLVFTTGSVEDADITLQMMYLPDESVTTITKLLSDEFPEDIYAIVDDIIYIPPAYPFESERDWFAAVDRALTSGFYHKSWSPDGRYLAFVGQMDGPSSDVYLYDVEKGDIVRITKDKNLVYNLEWSPEGDKILFTHVILGETDDRYTLHIADPADRNLTNPAIFDEDWIGLGWLSPTEYLTSWHGCGTPFVSLHVLNVETRKRRTIWPYAFDIYDELAINYKDREVLLWGWIPNDDPELEEASVGVYLVRADGTWEMIMQTTKLPRTVYRGGAVSDYLLRFRDSILAVSPDGSMEKISSLKDVGLIEISPDYRWVVLSAWKEAQLFDENDQLVREFPFGFESIKWHPDSKGFFYLEEEWVYYLPLPDGEPIPFIYCPEEYCWFMYSDFVWLEE